MKTPFAVGLTDEDIELLKGMRQVQQNHAARCLEFMKNPNSNTKMFQYQYDQDMARVDLISRLIGEPHGEITG